MWAVRRRCVPIYLFLFHFYASKSASLSSFGGGGVYARARSLTVPRLAQSLAHRNLITSTWKWKMSTSFHCGICARREERMFRSWIGRSVCVNHKQFPIFFPLTLSHALPLSLSIIHSFVRSLPPWLPSPSSSSSLISFQFAQILERGERASERAVEASVRLEWGLPHHRDAMKKVGMRGGFPM